MSTLPVAIRLEKLTRRYSGGRGIQDIDLTVQRGEIFGFLGPNGAGKSTTLRTMLGFMRPTSGRAKILGFDSQTRTREIHEHTGNLPGEFSLEDRLNGRDFLTLVSNLRGLESTACAFEIADRLDADLDRPMRRLSRGNKQKIGIVQALMHQPDLIVLDEPTGGLDPLAQERFLDLLVEARQRGQTVFFSSHVLSEVERVADRVGIIREGRLVDVEQVATLTGKALRHVKVVFAGAPPADTLSKLQQIDGVEAVAADGVTLAFTAQGHADEIVKLIARQEIVSLDVERPSLEEMFLSFYGDASPHQEVAA
jgi:ABC-2 type transport system ATP-binding protein